MLLESQVLFLLYAAHEAIKQRYRLGRQVALSPTSSTSTMLILPSDRDNPNTLNLTDYESVALCTQLVFQQVAVAYSQILYLANTSQTNTTLFIPRVLTDYCARLQRFYLSLPSTDTLSALVPASLENLSNASAAAFLVPIIASMQPNTAPIAPTAPLLLPSSNSSSLALVTIDESNTNTWEYWMPYIAMAGLLLSSGFAFRDKLFSVFHSFFERKNTSTMEVLSDDNFVPVLELKKPNESHEDVVPTTELAEPNEIHEATLQPFLHELLLEAQALHTEKSKLFDESSKQLSLNALQLEETAARNEIPKLQLTNATDFIPAREEDIRKNLASEEENVWQLITRLSQTQAANIRMLETNRTRLFTEYTKSAAIISTEGKSYFDDYAEDEIKNTIRDKTANTQPKPQLTYSSSSTSISSQASTPTSKSTSHPSSTKTEFKFEEHGNEINIVRESKPLDEKTPQRSVIWRFEGKSQLSIEQKYRELVEKALAFRLAEQKALQEEIAELRSNNSNPTRLAELELLDEKLNPTEITFSVPNQKETNRKAVDKTEFLEFSEFEIPEGEIKLTTHELLALKAHLQCFDIVRFGEMTFSRKPNAVLEHRL